MKVKKRVRTFGMMMVIFLTYIIFQRPDIASAADGKMQQQQQKYG